MNERCIEITEVEIFPVKFHSGLFAFASVVINNHIYLGSIAVHKKLSGGLRITYPTRKSNDTNFQIFHPISKEASSQIETAIFNKLKDVMPEVASYAEVS